MALGASANVHYGGLWIFAERFGRIAQRKTIPNKIRHQAIADWYAAYFASFSVHAQPPPSALEVEIGSIGLGCLARAQCGRIEKSDSPATSLVMLELPGRVLW